MESGQDRLEEILAEALAKSDPKARGDYLDKACAGDQPLRAKVEALIQAYEKGGEAVEKTLVVAPALNQEGPGTIIGRYKLLQEIGEGGFGLVFMAEQLEPVRRKVALKIIKAGMDTREVIARFEAERQALALMDHPNIARVLDAGATESGRPYFVMELVKGIRITDYCDENNLSTEERLGLFIQVCHAVQHAHQKGIIHRDLKPSNVMVTLHDGEAVPKVIDFGIAKATGQQLTDKTLFTRYEQMIGTPAYMSPEQAAMSGTDIDTRTDIYALGVLLYELLTGVTPFDQETLARAALEEIRRMIRETEPPKPSTRLHTMGEKLTEVAKQRHAEPGGLRRLVRGDLDWIVMKALEKDRSRRYGTAADLAEDVGRHLEHQPVLAGPPGAAYRARKFVRRHQVGVAMAAAVVVALALGLVVSLLGFAQARLERNRAVAAEHQTRRERDRAVTAEQTTQQERNTAELLAAEAALGAGQSKLEGGDSWGLFDMVSAFELAKHNRPFQETVGRRWSSWHTSWDRLTIAVYHAAGAAPSPEFLQSVSVDRWPPANTSKEVYLYDTLTGAKVLGPLAHDSVAVGSAFSPDGRLLATVTREGVIHLWDRRTGAPARPACATGVGALNQLSFSPCGRYLVAFSLWHSVPASPTAALLRLTEPPGPAHLLQHRFSVAQARFSQDGEVLAIGCEPGLQVWRTADLLPAGPMLSVTWGGLVELSPDGTQLAFNPQGPGGVSLLDTRTQRIIRQLPKQKEGGPYEADPYTGAFSHDGRLLACLDWRGNLDVWETGSGARPCPAQKLNGKLAGQLVFSPDDSLLAAGEAAGTVRVFRTRDGKLTHLLHLPRWAEPAFLTNGVLAARAGGMAHFWDLAASPLPGDALTHDALARAVEFDGAGKFLAVGGEGELRLWAMQPSPRLERIVGLPGNVLALTFCRADGRFAAFTDDGSLTFVEPSTGATTSAGNYGRGYGLSAALSPDARKLALYHYWELLVVNTQTGASQDLFREGGPRTVAFRRDSCLMAAGFAGWSLRLYDTTSETITPAGNPEGFESWVDCVAFHPAGNRLAAYVVGSGLYLYEPKTQRRIGGLRKTSVHAGILRFSDNGTLLAVAGPVPNGGHAVELWHVEPKRGLVFSGVSLACDQPVWSVAFSPDNRTLAVGGMGTTRLWYMPATPKDIEEVKSRTRETLGFRINEQERAVHVARPGSRADEVRARLTQRGEQLAPALDLALGLPPASSLSAIQELNVLHPGAGVYRKLLGRLHADAVSIDAEGGLWAETVAHVDQALRLGVDEPYLHYQRALACLGAGDVAGYRATCRAITERYRTSNDPALLKWVAWPVSVAPGALDDYADLVAQIQRALPRVGGPQAPDYRFYLGALLARAGRYQEALAELEQAGMRLKTEAGSVEFEPIYYEFLRGICYAHLGRKEVARQCYETATVRVRNLQNLDQERASTATTASWNRGLTIALLQAEAESLLKASPQPPTPSQ